MKKKTSEAHIGTKMSDAYGSNGQGLDMRTSTEVTLPLEQGQMMAMVFLAKGFEMM